MNYTFKQITSVLKGKVLASADDERIISNLLTDSRHVNFPGTSIFFALVTERRNAHQFIADLFSAGVRNFVVSEHVDISELHQANVLKVPDTLIALQQIAAWHRKQFNVPVIGITGSNGKTVVKEWLNQLLEDRCRVVRSPRSYNSQIGVPLSVWNLNQQHELAIFEAGISQADEMSSLQKIISPTIGVFTNLGTAHNEGFLNLQHKAREKLKLFSSVDVLVYCQDHPEINQAVSQLRHQGNSHVVPFNWSRQSRATVEVKNVEIGSQSSYITFLYEEVNHEFTIPFTDPASIENAIHCLCVLLWLKTPMEEIRTGMQKLRAVAMRLELVRGINDCSVINDSYSADINSLQIALDFLLTQKQHQKRTIILSDLLETGFSSRELYDRVAQMLESASISRLIAIGPAIHNNSSSFSTLISVEKKFYTSMEQFLSELPHISFSNEVVLLKGARKFGLEQVLKNLGEKVHKTVLEINLDALIHNLKKFQSLLRPGTQVMAMVKAFSYGSGSFEIASALQHHKVDYLAVAYADEGIDLRKSGIELPIMVMNTDEQAFESLLQYNLEPEIYSIHLLKALKKYLASQAITDFAIHIEVETGMQRLGFSEDQMDEVLEMVAAPEFHVKSVFTHLVASEDSQHDEFTAQQIQRFKFFKLKLQESITYPFLAHLSNSSGISRHPEIEADMVRLGIGMYGISSSDDLQKELREVSTLRATIASIKRLKAGETVGYGRNGKVNRESLIATVRIGYADGYPRSLSNGVGKMMVNDQLAPVIGNVCMDMTMIDITGIEGVHEEDFVTVFGSGLSVQTVAEWAGTIPYEILTGVSQRVKRLYFRE